MLDSLSNVLSPISCPKGLEILGHLTLNIIISNTKHLDMDLSSATRSSPRILFAHTSGQMPMQVYFKGCISKYL